jgi:formamidopyrimidine-DNA glycosylase
MPELPEVETMRRGILPVVGGRIVDVRRERCRLKPIAVAPGLATFRRRAVGRTIAGVGRVGKRVVVELDSDDRIVFEPRMTGLVLLADPPDHEHCRLRLDLEDAAAGTLLYWDRRGLGSVRLLSLHEFAVHFGAETIGPDALSVSAELLHERLGRSQRAIKVALLDQKAVAGIGNLYASEILFLAQIHPARPCRRLRRDDWRKLQAAVRKVLSAAIRCEGSTLSDGTYRNALNQAGSFQNHHRVYDRAGQKCPRCRRGTVTRIVQAQRSTFFCATCQR